MTAICAGNIECHQKAIKSPTSMGIHPQFRGVVCSGEKSRFMHQRMIRTRHGRRRRAESCRQFLRIPLRFLSRNWGKFARRGGGGEGEGEHEQLVASLQQCDGIQLSRVQTAWHGMRSEREGERGGAKQISNLGGGESG